MSVETNNPEPELLSPVLKNYLDAVKASVPFSGPCGFRKEEALRSELLEVLKWQTSIANCLEALQSKPNTISSEPRESQDLLRTARHGVQETQSFLARTLKQDVLATAPSESSPVKAKQVFDIPELAEMVLLNLPAQDVFNATRAYRELASSATSSAKVQTMLGLRGDKNSFWRCHFGGRYGKHASGSYLNGISCELAERSYWDPGPQEEVQIIGTIYTSRMRGKTVGSKPSIGSRVRSMLLCQPPVYEIKAKPSCCGSKMHPIVIESTTGVTVGDLMDAEEKLTREHRLCSFAPSSLHNRRTGEVETAMEIRGTLTLRSDDPVVETRRWCEMQPVTQPMPPAQKSELEVELDKYIQAKKAGEFRGGSA